MRRRILGPSALFAAVVVLATACGTHSSSVSAANPSALRIAFSDDMGVPDPDAFYGAEGLVVTNSASTRGCCSTRPDSFEGRGPTWLPLPADLARTASPTPSRCTPGIAFHDGTPLDAAAVAASFARRTAAQAEARPYVLAQVKSVATPDATTVVVPPESTR